MNALYLISGLSIFTLIYSMFKNQKALLPIAITGLAAAAILAIKAWGLHMSYFDDMLLFDNSALAFSLLMIGICFFILPLYKDMPGRTDVPQAEQYTLFLFSLVGGILMVSYHNLIMLFIGIELLSIPIYVLAGSHKGNIAGNESSLKYFLSGAFASGFILFGLVLIYGITGSLNVQEIADVLIRQQGIAGDKMLIAGVLLVLAGFCFKIAAVPFHFWAPDVYQGAPTYITAFMSTLVKTAAIAAFYRLYSSCFSTIELWQNILLWIAAASILIGNLTAAYQNSVKRMLAYSSISHAGYLLLALVAMNSYSANALFVYMCAYAMASIVAFSCVMLVEEKEGSDWVDAFNGLFRRSPVIAIALAISMLSLAGIPVTAGFIGKFSVFMSALKDHQVVMVIFALLSAAVGVYYYFRVITAAFFKKSQEESPYFLSGYGPIVMILLSILTIVFGVYPAPLLGLF